MKALRAHTPADGRIARALTIASLAAAVLFGCGGGVGTGGTGDYVLSVITGFGSVIVGGVEFDDATARVLDDDGAPVVRSGNELGLGMTVEVDGSTIVSTASGNAAAASTIRIATAVLGPVETVDATTGTLTVLGQQLQINAATVFGQSLHGGAAALHAGDVVAGYALPDATGGRYVATRIDTAQGATTYRLRGVVAALDATLHTLEIGGVTLSYASASGIPEDLANGKLVRVRLSRARIAGQWSADAFGPALTQPAQAEGALVEGLVTSYSGASSFVVDGMPVDASQAVISSGSPPIGADVYVSIEGRVSGGKLIAASVKVSDRSAIGARTYSLSGTVSGLDLTAKTFVVRGAVVDYSSAQFIKGSAASLANGVSVRVRGGLSPDGTQIQAAQIAFK
jgi:hypothetical protein